MNDYIKKALALRKLVGVSHHIPGRIRLNYKVGIIAHLAKLKTSEIESSLQQIPAFKRYKLNMATGSIVIEYDTSIVTPHVIEAIFSTSDSTAEQACQELAASLFG
ncbi:MAG: copper chaperone CopZ [Moritella sp.]|jgi:copper chaperone CopZ